MRLTHKHKYKTDSKRFVFDIKDYRNACQKLGQLEDIEEELGIDLITLHKLIHTKTIYSYGHTSIMENSISGIQLYDKTITIWNGTCHSKYPLSEYGKSFALTREELKCQS